MSGVRAMDRKLLRDLWSQRGQALAIALVMACGVATLVMSMSMQESLRGTLDRYYERARFAQVFTSCKRAPERLRERIAAIPGVAHAQTRVVERVTLLMPDLPEPVSGRVVSIGSDRREGLNLLHLRDGRWPRGRHDREALVNEAFAEAHGLGPGDTVDAVLNGRLQSLRIVGVALSPEFIYLLAPGAVLPDDERYAVLWMGRDEAAAAFDLDGAFNDVCVTLAPGASEQGVIAGLDALTNRYGGLGAYGRADQGSHKFVENEINELRAMTLWVPFIFLGVSAFLLNIVISRMIAVQREQIATLKALGYSRREIGRHYLLYVLLIALLSVAFGTVAGIWMGKGLTALYADFFRFPSFDYTLRPTVVLIACVVTLASALGGVANTVLGAMRLPPAEAMRPRPPISFRPTFLEKLGLHRLVSPAVRMILRQLERRPLKSALSCLGIALATSILVVGSYAEDAVDSVIETQYNQVQRYDVDVAFYDKTDDRVVADVRALPGALRVEPYRGLAVRLRHDNLVRRLGVLGVGEGELFRLLDTSGEPVAVPEGGLLVSDLLAELLGFGVGDTVVMEVLEGRRPTVEVRIAGLIEDFTGLAAYMRIDELNALMLEPGVVGGVYLQTDTAHLAGLNKELREAPRVAAVNVKASMVASFRATIAKNLTMMRAFNVSFAVIIAFGVVYNSARISLSERSRDLATLRVMGFTRAEISVIQLGELLILTMVAVPLGLVFGYGFARLISSVTESELFRIPFVIDRSTFAFAALIVVVAATVSALIVRRKLDRLDLVSVLKARE